MRKHSAFEKNINDDFKLGSHNWLLHARYVRGEHALCLDLAEKLQKKTNNTHRYAHFIKGAVLADAGKFQEAVDKFHSCTRLQPTDPEPLKQVAKCLYRQGRFQLALEAYLEADKLSKHPDPDIYCALAECAWSLGDAEHSIEWARAGEGAGGGERAGALLAKLLQAVGDTSGAIAAYDHALAAHACGADTLAAAGALCLRVGAPRRAFQLLGEALSQQPAQHAAALALAAMLLQHRDVDAALARLKAALSAHPTCVAAHSNLGLALLTKKKFVAALTCLQRSVWAAPLSARAAHNLGYALLLCKRPASAFCRLACSAALQPNQHYTVLLIAIALEHLGDSRADAAFIRAATLAPQDPLVRLNLAGKHARAGRLVEAVEEARIVTELLQGAPDAQFHAPTVTMVCYLASLVNLNLPHSELSIFDYKMTKDGGLAKNIMADEQQRQASLVILPPIILGYDDLIDEGKENSEHKPRLLHRLSNQKHDHHDHWSHEIEHVHMKSTHCNCQKNSRQQTHYYDTTRNAASKSCNHG